MLLLGGILLHGCATLSKTECIYGDWENLGIEDGIKGSPATQVSVYRRECARHGVVPDYHAYEEGRQEGLKRYCQASNGYIEGRSGRTYQNVCPSSSASTFLSGYQLGRELHVAKHDIESILSQITGNRFRIEQLNEKVDSFEYDIINDEGLSREDTERKLQRIKQIQKEIGRLEADIDMLQDKRIDAIVRYREVVRNNRSMGYMETAEY